MDKVGGAFMSFEGRIRKASIYSRFSTDELTVSGEVLEGITHYACYLYINDKVVVKRGYQTQRDFSFDLSPYSINDKLKIGYYFYNKPQEKRCVKLVDLTGKRLRSFILLSEIKSFSNDKLILLGKELVNEGKLQLGTFPQYFITDRFNFWEDDPFSNRSWQWRLHWFEFINHLLAYHHNSKDHSALDFAQESIESWWQTYWGKESNFEFIWHDHATALRAEILLIYLCYVQEYEPEHLKIHNVFFGKLEEFLFFLKDTLLEEQFYSAHTNHGLEQARVLLLLSVYFQNNKEQSVAVRRISSELEFSFTSEGVHKENSPGYHQFVLKVFLNIISRFPKQILGNLAERFDEIGARALGFIAQIIRPDGSFPILGDTEFIKPSDSYKEYFKNSPEYQEYLYSSSLGKNGQKPKDSFRVYEKSGYAIYRNHWGNRSGFDQIVQLILKAGCLSRYHHQQDESNVLLYAYGEDWLIDSGLYNYINTDPIRKYMRSRLAHNIPIIADSLYYPDFEHRLSNWSLSSFVDNNVFRIKTENSVLKDVIHKREVIISPFDIDNADLVKSSHKIRIIDEIFTQSKKTVSFCWHVPNDKIVNILNNSNVEIISKKTGKRLILILDKEAQNINIFKGIINGKVYSCTSKKFGTYMDSILIKVEYDLSLQSENCFVVTSSFEFYNAKKELIDQDLNNFYKLNKNREIGRGDVKKVEDKQLQKIIYEYQVSHYGFDIFKFSLPMDWRINPFHNKNWQHHFMSLRWINYRLLDEGHLFKLLLDFYNFHVKKGVSNPYYNFLRGDHTAAIRLGKITEFYHYYKDTENIPLSGILARLIRADIANLQEPKIYRSGHNHGLMVDNALLNILTQPEMASFHRLVNLDKILDRSLVTLKELYYDDGFTRENSISYQEYNLGVVWEYFQLIKKLKVEIDFDITQVIFETKKVLGLSLTSANFYFPLGDSYYKPKPKILEEVYGLDGDVRSDIASTRDFLLPYTSNNFSGYFFNKGLALYKYKDKVHFAQTIMYGSNTHKQDDELSYCLNVFGVPFVIDSGYSLIHDANLHQHMRSVMAHNNLLISNYSYVDIKDIKNPEVLDEFISYENDILKYHFIHNRYKEFSICNKVSISKDYLSMDYCVKSNSFHIEDKYSEVSKTLRIILHPNVEIKKDCSKLFLYSNGVSVEINFLCIEDVSIDIGVNQIIDENEAVIETRIIRVSFYGDSIQVNYTY